LRCIGSSCALRGIRSHRLRATSPTADLNPLL
jgi:hypothetical protein